MQQTEWLHIFVFKAECSKNLSAAGVFASKKKLIYKNLKL